MIFACADCTIGITLPQALRDDPILSHLGTTKQKSKRHFKLEILAEDGGGFAIKFGKQNPEGPFKRGAVLRRVLEIIAETFGASTLHASAVALNGRTALIVGEGKSSLAAWLIEKGFSYVADHRVRLGDNFYGLPGPLQFSALGAGHLASLADFGSAPLVKLGERFYISPKPEWHAAQPLRSGIVIFLNHVAGTELKLEKIYAAEAIAILQKNQTGLDDAALTKLAHHTPTMALTYSSFDQLQGVLDHLLHLALGQALSPVAFEKFVSFMPQEPTSETARSVIPARSDRVITCKLSIGMATYDDYDGVYFSIQAIRLYHPEIINDVEFIIIDNHPDGPCAEELKKLENPIPNLRYIPAHDKVGSTIKDRVFTEAQGEYVLCMDCHVMFVPGSLKKLLDYFAANPDTSDLLQGPLVYDDLKSVNTSWNTETWSGGMLGKWHSDARGHAPDNPPFEIAAQGMGAFACRKDAWPGFNPLFRGFGGEEVYIHGKFKQRGDKTLCLPFLVWLHRFGRPMGVKYPNNWEDRIRNALIGFRELAWNTSAMVEHFQDYLGKTVADRIIADVYEEFGWPAETQSKIIKPRSAEPLSVIMPCYNAAHFLGEAIESILTQTRSDFEFIIVNDGSTDDSRDILDKYARQDRRIIPLHTENRGEAQACNTAIAAARYHLIARLDSDDVAMPERLAMQSDFMHGNPDCAIVGSYMQKIDRAGIPFDDIIKYPLSADACHASLQISFAGPIGNPAAMLRKAVFDKIGGYRQQFAPPVDFDFWLRCDEHFKFGNIPEVLLHYRWHGNNSSASKRFEVAVITQIARLCADMRRSGKAEPKTEGAQLDLAFLALLLKKEPQSVTIFKNLRQLAKSIHIQTKQPHLLKAVEECNFWITECV